MKRQQFITPGRRATAHTMLLMMTAALLLSSGVASSIELRAAPGRQVKHNHQAPPTTAREGATKRDGPIGRAAPATEAPGFPGTLFPRGVSWATTKAPPKKSLSLLPIPQNKTAAAWMLNLIELIHWASFPLGFYVAYFVFENAPSLAKVLGGSTARVFFIMLGLMCQVFGGGISGNMMHLYEGWQVAPFRNPLQSSPPGQKFPVEEFNNAWLRTVAYQMLFTFQTLGLGLFTMGVYGVTNWTKLLVVGSTAVALLGPKEPRLGLTRMVNGEQRPVLPLSLSLVVVFAINVVANLLANVKLFARSMEEQIPFFVDGIVLAGWVVAVIPTLLIAAGGAIEGWFAESSFNQWHHFIAFVTLLAGLSSSLMLYQHLVNFIIKG